MEIRDLRESVAALNEKAAKDKESLKKATRAQKLRAQRFEAAVEKCYAQLKEKVWIQDIHFSNLSFQPMGLLFNVNVLIRCWTKGRSAGRCPSGKRLQETAEGAADGREGQAPGSCRAVEEVGFFLLLHTPPPPVARSGNQYCECWMCVSVKVKSRSWRRGCRRRGRSWARLVRPRHNVLKSSALKTETSASIMQHWRYTQLAHEPKAKELLLLFVSLKWFWWCCDHRHQSLGRSSSWVIVSRLWWRRRSSRRRGNIKLNSFNIRWRVFIKYLYYLRILDFVFTLFMLTSFKGLNNFTCFKYKL